MKNILKKAPTTEEEWAKYQEELAAFILAEWKKKGTVSDEEATKEFIDIFQYLLANYRLKCLLGTIIGVDDLNEKFDEQYVWEE